MGKFNKEIVQDFEAYYKYTLHLFRENREEPITEEQLKGHADLTAAFMEVYPGILGGVKEFIENYTWILDNINQLQLHQVEHYLQYLIEVSENEELGVCILIMWPGLIPSAHELLHNRKIDILERRGA